ncbi:YY1-associated factor 2-like [Pollicipes pollicipes]|uniref:YY1-associated factor 2-like n=1 Tax=Pollicipes pollicipes TaxID=41117 RepID=UPI00188545DF|nr:YY1-associated factor 2-like [Pollicipes pollicipes]
MDRRESPAGKRGKRVPKPVDDNSWDCSVCTYKNTAEAFKCLMCDVRKGTSTRKPRLNQDIQQVQTYTPPVPKAKRLDKKDGKGLKGLSRLRGVDRSQPTHQAVTINDVTVIITEFRAKAKDKLGASGASTGDTSSLSESDRHSEASNGLPELQVKA